LKYRYIFKEMIFSFIITFIIFIISQCIIINRGGGGLNIYKIKKKKKKKKNININIYI